MLTTKFLNKLKFSRSAFSLVPTRISQRCSSNKTNNESDKITSSTDNTNLGKMGTKYQVFREQDSEEILDIYEERNKYAEFLEEEHKEDKRNYFEGLNLERGLRGVFDIEDLVEVLKRENGQNIFVASVPQELKYVDYICLVNGKSVKHMQAICQFVRRVFKQKRSSSDQIPKLEGEKSKDWMALDLGNIALHIFSPEARNLYDLDSLWSVGPKYDKELNKEDPIVQLLEKHSFSLHDLQPASA